MNAKTIIIKTLNQNAYSILCQKLLEYPKMHFYAHQINGEYTCVIKCDEYYARFFQQHTPSIYGNYTYLYTNISLILCSIIIDLFEETIMETQLKRFKTIFSENFLQKAKIITSFFLDANYPSRASMELFLYKKELIFRPLLWHFKQRNYLTIEAFVYFSLEEYHAYLDTILLESFSILIANQSSKDFINFILNNFLK